MPSKRSRSAKSPSPVKNAQSPKASQDGNPASSAKLHAQSELLLPPPQESSLDTSQARTSSQDHVSQHHKRKYKKNSNSSKDSPNDDGLNEEDIELGRDDLVKWVAEICEYSDSQATLFRTIILTAVFLAIVEGHLYIRPRQQVESSLASYLNGRNEYVDLANNVEGQQSFRDWLNGEFMQSVFGVSRNTTLPDGRRVTQFILSERNILLGDVRLAISRTDGEAQTFWLLHHPSVSDRLANLSNWTTADTYRDVAVAAAQAIEENPFWNKKVSYASLELAVYNKFVAMVSKATVEVHFRITGYVRISIKVFSIPIEPYSKPVRIYSNLILDFLYVIFLARTGVLEGKEAIAAMRHGLYEFRDYLTIWNIIDWTSIFLAFANITTWVLYLLQLREIQQMYFMGTAENNYALDEDVMKLSVLDLETLFQVALSLEVRYVVLLYAMNFQTMAIVANFFKSFRTNKRLSSVMNTLTRAGVDLIHFVMVLMTVFWPFAIVGNLLFGRDISALRTLFSSSNNCFLLLLGEMGWYNDALLDEDNSMTGQLPSGTPKVVLAVWYILYMFFVFLVLMNILIAIVIEHYTVVVELQRCAGTNLPIWEEIRNGLHFRKETRGFYAMERIRLGLEDDDDPQHPQHIVTEESLMEAFPKVEVKQANFICARLRKRKYVRLKNEVKEVDNRNTNIENLEQRGEEALSTLTERIGQPSSQKAAGAPDMAAASAHIDRLAMMLQRSIREQGRLGKRLDKCLKNTEETADLQTLKQRLRQYLLQEADKK